MKRLTVIPSAIIMWLICPFCAFSAQEDPEPSVIEILKASLQKIISKNLIFIIIFIVLGIIYLILRFHKNPTDTNKD